MENDDWIKNVLQAFRSVHISYFSTKTYVVGTQNKHLNETVLFSWAPKTIFNSKKINTILRLEIIMPI